MADVAGERGLGWTSQAQGPSCVFRIDPVCTAHPMWLNPASSCLALFGLLLVAVLHGDTARKPCQAKPSPDFPVSANAPLASLHCNPASNPTASSLAF